MGERDDGLGPATAEEVELVRRLAELRRERTRNRQRDQVLRVLEGAAGALSTNAVVHAAQLGRETVFTTLAGLEADGLVRWDPGPRNAQLWSVPESL